MHCALCLRPLRRRWWHWLTGQIAVCPNRDGYLCRKRLRARTGIRLD